jgi:tetratricopeptide (TPR) repeat protein/MFS family permease
MMVELVAGRLIARHLGSSLYTWTSVIGVVLAGITIGNYLGGRIADRFHARKALAVLLGISSASCVVTVVLNNLAGDWIWLWKLSWPVHVLAHVFVVFMLPSTLLGTISPIVAKMALDQGLPAGRTVGDIYAFGAAGSIAGTFLAGFYLIATIGTVAIIWSIGAALLLMAILFRPKFWLLYIWAAIFAALMNMGMVHPSWAKRPTTSLLLNTASSLALREEPNPSIIYEDESQYSYITVRLDSDVPNKRSFREDKLTHSMIVMGDILNLQYSYEQIYAGVTHLTRGDRSSLSVLAIGGGGYVFPRYIEKVWPGSRVDVAEIDPRVTEAAIQAFGLDRNTTIKTFPMDARNYIDMLLREKQTGGQIPQYDIIYEDAINDYSVPYQLTTREFNDKISQILTDDGIYMVNLIDTYHIGLFLGAIVRTLEQTFPNIYVIADEQTRKSAWGTFVIVASRQKINLENLASEERVANLDLWILNDSEIEALKKRGRWIVLTDDYAPVENLLAPVVRQSIIRFLPAMYLERARKLERRGRWNESIEMYEKAVKSNPEWSFTAYNSIGQILAGQGKWQEAVDAAKAAVEYNEKARIKHSVADIYFNMSLTSRTLGKDKDASEYMNKAIEAYKEDLAQRPTSTKTLRNMGRAYMEAGRFSEAVESFRHAIDIDPHEVLNYLALADALLEWQRYNEAINVLKKAIVSFSNARNEAAVIELQRHLWYIEDKGKSKK